MATRANGNVLERHWKQGRGYALRFSAYGERRYLSLGFERDGWTKQRAEEELANVMADVRRGIWVPPKKTRSQAKPSTDNREGRIFGPFARGLVEARRGQISESATKNEEWALGYVLGYFADWSLQEIDVQSVDAFRLHMVDESDARRRAIERRKPRLNRAGAPLRPLSPGSINKTITFLQWVLSVALEYKFVTENVAVGKRRRLRVPQVRPVHLDSARQIEALLDAAADLDRDIHHLSTERKAIVATLVLAGPRAQELCHLLWRDIDLANGRILIGRSKTQAGLREIKMLPILRDVLAAHKARSYRSGPDDLVFPTGTGGLRDRNNLRTRILQQVFENANELLLSRGQVPLPKGITTHKLRHTFASVLIACGEDPISVMTQIGHTDPSFTLRVYSHAMSRDPEERARLKALVKGELVIARDSSDRPPKLTDQAAYEVPILRILDQHGGRAPRHEVLAGVREVFGSRMTDLDLEKLPSGSLRWEARASKARQRLVKRGYIEADSPRGIWKAAPAGFERLRKVDSTRSHGVAGPPRVGHELSLG